MTFCYCKKKYRDLKKASTILISMYYCYCCYYCCCWINKTFIYLLIKCIFRLWNNKGSNKSHTDNIGIWSKSLTISHSFIHFFFFPPQDIVYFSHRCYNDLEFPKQLIGGRFSHLDPYLREDGRLEWQVFISVHFKEISSCAERQAQGGVL